MIWTDYRDGWLKKRENRQRMRWYQRINSEGDEEE